MIVGQEGFVFLHEKSGRERKTLVGAARVRIDAVEGDVCTVTLLAVSGPDRVGRRMEFTRNLLHVTREELARFAADVRRFWPPQERSSKW